MLDRLREHAEKWRTGLVALTGLVATTTAVTAPFVGIHLLDDQKAAVGIAALVALGALALGAMAAMRAAYGLPTTIHNTGTALREWTIGEVKASAWWLKVARGATLVGFGALVVAATIGFLHAGAAPRLATVEPAGGKSVCGTLKLSGKTLTVTAKDGTVHRFNTATVGEIEDTAEC